LPELSAEMLARLADAQSVASVRVGLDAAGGFSYTLT
jgi:hypothetical protein